MMDLVAPLVARESAATAEAAVFGDSAAKLPCFLHGGKKNRVGTLGKSLRRLLAMVAQLLGLYP